MMDPINLIHNVTNLSLIELQNQDQQYETAGSVSDTAGSQPITIEQQPIEANEIAQNLHTGAIR
jgi:hypothetical protein